MIRPLKNDPFFDQARVLAALRQARTAARRLAAANGQSLIDWQDGNLLTTDAVITEIKEKGNAAAGADMGGMDY